MNKNIVFIIFLVLSSCTTPVSIEYKKIDSKIEATEGKVKEIDKNIYKIQKTVVSLKKTALNENCKKDILEDVNNIEMQLIVLQKDIKTVESNLIDLKSQNETYNNICKLEIKSYKIKSNCYKIISYLLSIIIAGYLVVRNIKIFK